MISFSEIKTKLNEGAKSLGLNGQALDYQISLLSSVFYELSAQFEHYKIESDINTANLLSNVILHSVKRMYSAYRGTNARIFFQVKSKILGTFNKLDEVYSGNGIKLFSAQIVTYYPDTTFNLECIVAKDIFTETIINNEKTYGIVFSNLTDLSEDFVVSVNSELKESTRLFFDHIIFDQILGMTLPDYSIKLFKKDYFNNGDTVTLKILKLYTEKFESVIDRILLDNFEILGYTVTPYLQRDSIDLIRDNANYTLKTFNAVSNTDFKFLFNEVFKDKVLTSNILMGDPIYVYYIPKSTPITSEEVTWFKDTYKSYFISQEIEVTLATKVINILSVDIFVTAEIDQQAILNVFDKYENKLGITLNMDIITGNLIKVNGISYISNLTIQQLTALDFEYFKFELHITYYQV